MKKHEINDNEIIPELNKWECEKGKEYFIYENEVVRARYEEILGLDKGTILSTFLIIKNHYKDRMADVIKHINYFLTFYDTEKELFLAILSIKFIIDQNNSISQKMFKKLIMDRVVTDTLMNNVKRMANDLYTINIDTDAEGKFKSTPKITNDQARQIVALSFCFRLILPLCIHFSNTNVNFVKKKDYIEAFDKIFIEIIEKFEKDDVKVFNSLYRFVKYQVDRTYNADRAIWKQKKQLYGHTKELYLEEVVHEVIIVKSLHKLEYNKSCVSFIHGVIFGYNKNYRHENYKVKPYEIDGDESNSDSDDYFSHAEALEMSVYRIDESNALINDINNKKVMEVIDRKFSNIPISKDEMKFYKKNCKLNAITQFLIHSFFSRYFNSSYSIYTLNKDDTFKLLIYMKKFLELKGMVILPQICTAKVQGKFKDNSIKNSKFIEKFVSSSVYENIISTKFKYIKELNAKEDPIVKKLSTIINSTFIFVDYDSLIDGYEYKDVNTDIIIDEFLLFLSII